MPDIFTKEKRSEIMAKIRSKNTKLELVVFKYLRAHRVHFQRHYKHAKGCPDVCVPSKKIAVFIDGDFWHGYRYPAWRHKMKPGFWQEKIERNRARDKRNFATLRRTGWQVLRVWEHDLRRDPFGSLTRIHRHIVQERGTWYAGAVLSAPHGGRHMKTAIDALKGKIVTPARLKKLRELRISTVEQFVVRMADKDDRLDLQDYLGLSREQMLRAIGQAKVLLNSKKPAKPKSTRRTTKKKTKRSKKK